MPATAIGLLGSGANGTGFKGANDEAPSSPATIASTGIGSIVGGINKAGDTASTGCRVAGVVD